ncbi:hypothetical protein C1N32_19830 [Vibrio diazotrophicus]|jgi:hypothetical protein|uniref:Uncharacterized protein n=1 Tax=Vibrio diazotrophicus TaxID=685 RepID=A0A2J8HU99_VIBDI|nr:hypothetical protein C1N32_19830 [Vibrio diazotrophicus]RAS55295.1 hypothetical protein DET48_14619 [Vibrio diazotrophicus]
MKVNVFIYIKIVFFAILSSGLILKTAQIYGLAYYTGYLRGNGFYYYLFRLEWEETLLWTYFASQDLGTKFLTVLDVSVLKLLFVISVCFV